MRTLIAALVLLIPVLARGQSIPSRLVLERSLSRPDASAGAHFGYAVAVLGSPIAVGSPSERIGTVGGDAFLFDGASALRLDHTASPGDRFGFAIARAGTNVVVGIPGTNGGAGAASIFDASGALVRDLPNPSPDPGDRFGFAVAATSSLIVVGAPGDDDAGEDAGAAYLFDVEGHLIASLDRPSSLAADQFGAAVAIDGSRILVGAPFDSAMLENAGAVSEFGPLGTFVREIRKPAPAADDLFGAAIDVVGGTTIVGAPLDDTAATDAGAVYVFDDRLTEPARLTTPALAAGDALGSALAVLGSRLAAGAPLADAGATDAGSVLVFDVSVGDAEFATLLQALTSPLPTPGGRFGFALASGDASLVVGAPREGAAEAGTAHVFVPSRCESPQVLCDDGNACTSESCNPATGQCETTSLVTCNGCEQCNTSAGTCETSVTCDDSNACTTVSCNTATGQCDTTSTVICNDTNPCTAEFCNRTTGQCDSVGSPLCDPATDRCVDSGAPCDDGDPCHSGSCDPDTLRCVFSLIDGCDSTPPSVPTAFTLSPVACTRIDLSWSASTDSGGSGLRGYNLFRDGHFLKFVLAPATSTSDTGLTPSTLYGYQLSAVDNAGNSSPQTSAVTSTPACPTTTSSTITTTTTTTTPITTTTASTSSTTTTTLLPCSEDRDCPSDPAQCVAGQCRHCDGCFAHDWPCCPDTGPHCVSGHAAEGSPCDDGNDCTADDSCSRRGVCLPGQPSTGTPCDDKNPCTTMDTCADRQCIGGMEFDCHETPDRICTTDTCQPVCTEDACPVCKHFYQCGEPCTTAADCQASNDPCLPVDCRGPDADDRTCINVHAADGTPCPNADPCDGAETCADGLCIPGTPLDCGDPCQGNTCERGTGCRHVEVDRFRMTSCRFAAHLAELPCDPLPAPIATLLMRAQHRLESTAAKRTRRGQSKALARASELFVRASRRGNLLARKGHLRAGCGEALHRLIGAVIGEIETLRTGLRS
jgi:chitodextrinase